MAHVEVRGVSKSFGEVAVMPEARPEGIAEVDERARTVGMVDGKG